MSPPTSPSLLDRARANAPDAWSRIAALYGPLVRHWCRRAGLSPHDADDVAQEVFASASSHLADFRPGSFRGWLRVIARNALVAHHRRNGKHPVAEGGSEALERLHAVPDEDEREEMDGIHRRAVEQVRGEFEAGTWRAFWLTVVEGRSTALVPAEAGLTPAAVRQARSRVLRRLREEMGDLIA